MGNGIAQVSALAGFKTLLFDLNEEVLHKSKSSIEKSLIALVSKGKIAGQERDETIARLTFTNNIAQCIADVFIEAIVEDLEAKISLFSQLQTININRSLFFATNTSSLSITKISEGLHDPSRLAGMHFFNPATVMKLVEVVKGKHTSTETFETIYRLAEQFSKTPVLSKDVPGFIVNRVARHYYLEAMKLVETGVADIETVDIIMEATGFKMGPFKLMDLIGMDVNYSVSKIVYEALDQPYRLTPSALQKQKVDAAELGKKSGRGFYNYGH